MPELPPCTARRYGWNRIGIPPLLLWSALFCLCVFLLQTAPRLPDHFRTGSLDPSDLAGWYDNFSDYTIHWTAGYLTAHDRAPEVYDAAATTRFFSWTFSLSGSDHAFEMRSYFYPPPALLLMWPFGYLDFRSSVFLFLGGSLLLLGAVMFAGYGLAGVLLFLGAPAVWICLWEGQNGLLTAAITGLLVRSLPTWRSGFFLSLLCIKPHLAVGYPVVFLYGRTWKPLVAAGIGVAFLGFVTTYLFGLFSWSAWLDHGVTGAWSLLMTDRYVPLRLASLFGFLVAVGVSPNLALVLHASIAVCVLFLTARAFTRTPDRDLRVALLTLSSLLISPMVYDYDLPLSLIAFCALFRFGRTHPLTKLEKLLMALIYLSPALMYPAVLIAVPHFPGQPPGSLVPFFLFGLCGCTLWRVVRLYPGGGFAALQNHTHVSCQRT